MSRGKRRPVKLTASAGVEPQLNVTPLVDVVLVLLIIFMVVAPDSERALRVDLPAEQRVEAPSAQAQVLVSVAASGALRVNNVPVARERYVSHLRRLLAQRRGGEEPVYVIASDGASYAELVEVIDQAREAGATRVGLATADAP